MKKKRMLKMAAYCLFVLAAGVVYACGTGSGKEIVLEQDRDGLPSSAAEGKSGGSGDTATDKRDETAGTENNGGKGGDPTSGQNRDETGVGGDDFRVSKEDAAVRLYVHVCGAVKQPGVYILQEDSRVSDAIAAAGGLLPDAAGDCMNQARKVADGERVYIPNQDEADEYAASGLWQGESLTSGNGTVSAVGGIGPDISLSGKDSMDGISMNGKVNINTATKEQLMQLSGIGATRADAIIAYREEHGGFQSREDLMKVDGIKGSVYNKICEDITAGG